MDDTPQLWASIIVGGCSAAIFRPISSVTSVLITTLIRTTTTDAPHRVENAVRATQSLISCSAITTTPRLISLDLSVRPELLETCTNIGSCTLLHSFRMTGRRLTGLR